MTIIKNKFICFQTNFFFLMLHLNDHLYIYKNHVSFVGREFLGSHRRFCTPSNTFTGFHRWRSRLTTTNESFTRWGVYPCLLLPDTYFLLLFHITVRPYWTASNSTGLTQSNTICSVDYNHALTPIQCNVLVHMQCNTPLHLISCHVHNLHGQC